MISREERKRNLIEYLDDVVGARDYYLDTEDRELIIEVLKKQTPKKPKEFEDKYYTCPECGNLLMYKWMVYPEKLMPRRDGLPCCLNCLQAIDWSDSDD